MSSLAGSFLIARPVLTDPNFRQSVVLLLAHDKGGAYGVVVNRPVAVPGLPFSVFQGGPCPSPGLVMLHGEPEWVDEAGEKAEGPAAVGEIVTGIFVGDASCLTKAGNAEPGQNYRYRIFQGYAGWGPGQLEAEIAADGWAVVPANGQLLFDVPPEELWARLRPRGIPEPSAN